MLGAGSRNRHPSSRASCRGGRAAKAQPAGLQRWSELAVRGDHESSTARAALPARRARRPEPSLDSQRAPHPRSPPTTANPGPAAAPRFACPTACQRPAPTIRPATTDMDATWIPSLSHPAHHRRLANLNCGALGESRVAHGWGHAAMVGEGRRRFWVGRRVCHRRASMAEPRAAGSTKLPSTVWVVFPRLPNRG